MVLTCVYAALISAFAVVAHHIIRYGAKLRPVHVSPDGVQYLAMSNGVKLPPPYGLRWLLPAVVSHVEERHALSWCIISWVALTAMGPLVVYYLPAGTPRHVALFAVVLVIGLPGVFRVNVIIPVLVDAMAMAFMLTIAGLLSHGHLYSAIAAALVGAMVRETTPIFAALAAWSVWPLVGLVAAAVRYAQIYRRDRTVVDASFSSEGKKFVTGVLGKLPGLNGHGHRLLEAKHMVAPWGLTLLAALRPDLQLGITIAIAYSQLAHGMDKSRLYQWAFPVVVARAAPLVPRKWMILAAIAHIFHPWNDQCV